MPELTTIPAAELADLRDRLARLARDKAQLQLVALLMNRLGELSGLEETAEGMVQFMAEILGGLNVALYFRLDEAIHRVDVHGKETLSAIDDELVREVFETHEFSVRERDFSRTGLMTREFTSATTWAMPLLVGRELVGVLRMDDLTVVGDELREEVQTFLRHASLVLKNEISGESRLRRAFEEVSRANHELTREIAERRRAESELQRAKDELEGRVAERTVELQAANERLRQELGERARAEAELAARHSTLRGIIEGTYSPIFSVDRQYRYVAFNNSHAAVMRALYGVEIELGGDLLSYMTVAQDREKARGHIDRALRGEHVMELAYSGEESRSRNCFEVSHHPVRAEDGEVIGVAVFATDVTDRQRVDAARRVDLWVSESLDRVNRAIQGTQDLEQMMSDVLDAVLEVFGCDRAFLLYPCDPHASSYRVPMERTRPEFPGALAQGVEIPVDAASASVLRAVSVSPEPVTFSASSEPPLTRTLRATFRVQSQIAMALRPRGAQPYVFGLHQCSHPRTWRPEEKRLLQEVGRRLSDALTARLAQEELRASEERYRAIFQNSPLGIFSSTFEGRFLVANPALARILGYDSPEAVVREIQNIGTQVYVDPGDRSRIVAQQARLTGVTRHETRLRRKDGSEFIANQYLLTGRDGQGQPRFLEGILEDVTERVRAEEALRAERGLFVGGPTVVFKWRAAEGWPVEYVSPNVTEIFGLAAEDFTSGRVPYASVVHPDDVARVGGEVEAYSEQGAASFEQIYRVVRPDGGHRWVDDFTNVVRGRDGRITHYHGYVLDMTERKQAEIELARVNRALRMLSDSNQALIHATEEAGLLREVCRIAVETGGHHRVWVGLTGAEGAAELRLAAQASTTPGDLATTAAPWEAGGHGAASCTRALLTGRTCLVTGEEGGAARGSGIALPLLSEGTTLGILFIDAAEPAAFDAKEVGILEEMASDVALGVNALRTRATRDLAQAALQKSEEKYRTLIQKIQAAVVVHGADTRIVTCNSQAVELLGLPEEQLLGRAALDPAWHFFRDDGTVMPPAEYPVNRVLATRQPLRGLTTGVHRPRGDDVWLLVNADPVPDEAGVPAQVIVTFIDITERKRAEEALRRREAELGESQRVAHVGSWDWDEATDTTRWSPELYRIYGIDPGQPHPEYAEYLAAHTPESAVRLDALRQRALRTGESYEVDLEVADPRASARWVVARGEAWRDAQGVVRGMRGTTQDITERKRLELEMRRTAAAIEQAAESIVITDPDAVVQYVNPAFTRVTGYAPEEVLGRCSGLWRSGRLGPDFYRSVWDTLRRGETWRGHLVDERKDGTDLEEDATISPVRDEGGRIVHYVAVKRDVTQEAALEAQLRHSQKMEAIGRLAGGIAHDFNNLLQALLSHAQVLRLSPERGEAELSELEDEIRRGAALTRQLLLFSRRQEAHREVFDLNEAIAALAGLLRRLVRENVTFVLELHPEPLIVDADRGQVDQVVMNLAINATDAMSGGGRLSIRTRSAGAMACLVVEDTGCGIPEAIRSRIFEPLFTTKPVGLGTGLGLYLVREIVSQHGGRVEVQSAEEVGTTFRVFLPAAAAVVPAPTPPPARDGACPAGRAERILVVEDGAAARAGLRAILRSLRYDVTTVGSAVEAWALPAEPAYDVLLSDVMLPDADGPTLVRGLLERWPGAAVILMSGYSEADVLERTTGPGKVHFLQKPFDMDVLARILREALSRR